MCNDNSTTKRTNEIKRSYNLLHSSGSNNDGNRAEKGVVFMFRFWKHSTELVNKIDANMEEICMYL